jgi:hypothetical protein
VAFAKEVADFIRTHFDVVFSRHGHVFLMRPV